MKLKIVMSRRNRDHICLQNGINDHDDTSSALLVSETDPKLFWTRWIVAGIVFLLGCQVGFSMIIWEMWGLFAVEYFDVTSKSFNMIAFGLAFGSIFTAFPLAIITQQHPNSVRALLQFGICFFGLGFLIEAIVVVVPRQVNIMALGQLICGIGNTVYFALAPLVATVWFAEREQGTFFGIVWFSIGFGQVIGNCLPLSMSLNSQNLTSQDEVHGLLVTLSSFACMDLIIALLITSYLLALPQKPPSIAEAHRLSLSRTNISGSYWDILCSVVAEVKVLFTNRISVTIMFVLSTFVATYVMHFTMMPVPQAVSNFSVMPAPQAICNKSTCGNETFETKQIKLLQIRSPVLLAMSLGAIPGSIVAGLCIDRIKKYQPLALIITLPALISSVLILVGFYFDVFALQCIACGLFGFFCFASICFFNEILKQLLYQSVRETTFGACLSLVINVLIIVYFAILWQIKEWGSIWYMVSVCIIIALALILCITINPELKRFNYDTEQTNLQRNVTGPQS